MTNEEMILLGKLSGQVETLIQGQETQNKSIGKLFDGLNEINKVLSALPCSAHEDMIQLLNEWKDSCLKVNQDVKLEEVKGVISLRNAIIGGIIIALISNIPSIILLLQKAG